MAELQQGLNIAVQEKPELFTLTLEADNIFVEFIKVDRYRAATINHELIQFCQSLRIIEATTAITKEEQE